MGIRSATTDYESWLARYYEPDPDDLRLKHLKMADADDPFPFFRATYYRWRQLWAGHAGALDDAPIVPSVGDLHAENFGTWRDAEGRLCWGVNDFDEADALPFTHDLVRLAASVRCARRAGHLNERTAPLCRLILDGYRESLIAGGKPFVLEGRHAALRAAGMAKNREPDRFWDKLSALLKADPVEVPADAKAILDGSLPSGVEAVEYRFRHGAGVGSLGRPRYVALAEWQGGMVCREVKAVAPPASAWASGHDVANRAAETLAGAVRSPDPLYRPGPAWVVRRLGPRDSRLELNVLGEAAGLRRILRAMGAEAANVHLGDPEAVEGILADLDRRPQGWLAEAAKAMGRAVEQDWRRWHRRR